MNNEKFDRLLSTIRKEQVDDKIVEQASERVWRAIGGDSAAADLSTHTLRTCEDFRALIPGYLQKELSTPRALLFDDHVHACVACRHALERAREGATQVAWKFETESRGSRVWQFALGAAAVAAIAFIVIGFNAGLLPGQHSQQAAVQSVNGSLYSVAGDRVRLIPAGYTIGSGDEVR